jgi:hypothetical protein
MDVEQRKRVRPVFQHRTNPKSQNGASRPWNLFHTLPFHILKSNPCVSAAAAFLFVNQTDSSITTTWAIGIVSPAKSPRFTSGLPLRPILAWNVIVGVALGVSELVPLVCFVGQEALMSCKFDGPR